MSQGTFGFLPWMRQGLAGTISQSDSFSVPGSLERATMNVEIAFNGQSLPPKIVSLVGPGDIVGIAPDVFVRTDPQEGVFDYEANCLPYIEFYEEDFPWRYTPASAINKRLRPWLALIVLKDDEYTFVPTTTEGLPSKIIIDSSVPLADIFHPHGDHWAWAHVHVHQPADSTSEQTLITNFKQDLLTNPDMAVSRLLSSRRLEPQTQYTAFLIPAFETGRQAGLGKATSGIGSLLSSWHLTDSLHPSNTEMPRHYPVYKQWRFGTGALGDFETLARALQPRIISPALGTRPMDVDHSGMGLDGEAPQPVIGMEGALAPTGFVPEPAATVANTDDYTKDLLDLLNLSSAMQVSTFPSSTNPTPNPYTSTTIQNDPVVLPPIYGQWHADENKVQSTSPMWLQELNLDPRYRAAAGLGARTVRERQEEFMEAAWKQIGEVLAVNEKIAKARLAMEASQSIYNKHLIGKLDLSSAGIDDAMNTIVKVAGPSFKKISVLNPAYNPSDPLNNNQYATALKAARVSNLTKAGIDTGFRKITRNRSNIIEKAKNGQSFADVNDKLAAKINSDAVKAAPPLVSPAAANPIGSYSVPGTSPGASYTSSSIIAALWKQIYFGQVDALKKTLLFLDQKELKINPPLPTIAATTFVSTVKATLTPDVQISERVKKMISLQVGGTPQSVMMKQIMAYPVIDEPMYDDLVKISAEYLLPNLGQYPNNTVTLLSTNNRFIEAYMAGLNHEFARELLWREYPTDQRGSYFRRFWDINDTINNSSNPDYLYDIKQMHTWLGTAHLGENHTARHAGSSSYIVMLIRGDLLKKYPNALIYAQKAKDYDPNQGVPQPRELEDAVLGNGNIDSAHVKFPLFKASLQPDIVLLGFNLTKDEVLGNTPSPTPGFTNAGWYFVLRERPGQVRFGLDEPAPLPQSALSWDDLTWKQMDPIGNDANVKLIQMSNVLQADINALNLLNSQTADALPVTWGTDAAIMAWILYQNPVMVAIHANDMIG